jgi:hypothetical protein
MTPEQLSSLVDLYKIRMELGVDVRRTPKGKEIPLRGAGPARVKCFLLGGYIFEGEIIHHNVEDHILVLEDCGVKAVDIDGNAIVALQQVGELGVGKVVRRTEDANPKVDIPPAMAARS